MTAPFFAADGLGVSFDRPVLENVCFGLERGTLTGLLGANGRSAVCCPIGAGVCWRGNCWRGSPRGSWPGG